MSGHVNDDIEQVAKDASYHASDSIVNTAHPDSKYAHGANDNTTALDSNTTLPSTKTNIDGAYSIGQTSTSNTAQNYDNKFTTPATETVGTGSRTVQPMAEQVQDLGTTVQTHTTRHIVQDEVTPTAYIPPQASGHITTESQTSAALNDFAASSGSASSVTQRAGNTLDSSVADVGHTTGGQHHHQHGHSTTTTTTTQQAPGLSHEGHHHHGIIGSNKTVEPTEATYTLNPNSGAAIGTSMMGIPHGSTGTTAATSGATTTGTTHDASTGTKEKTSIFSKIKHALS